MCVCCTRTSSGSAVQSHHPVLHNKKCSLPSLSTQLSCALTSIPCFYFTNFRCIIATYWAGDQCSFVTFVNPLFCLQKNLQESHSLNKHILPFIFKEIYLCMFQVQLAAINLRNCLRDLCISSWLPFLLLLLYSTPPCVYGVSALLFPSLPPSVSCLW